MTAHDDISIVAGDPGAAEAVETLRAYFADIIGRAVGRAATGVEVEAAMRADPADELAPPRGVFLMARRAGRAVGCAGVEMVSPRLGEVKRVFVAASARGRGIGSALMDAIEARARDLGALRLRLDTRSDLVAARGLYLKHGYAAVPPFNDDPHVDCWLAKTLG